MSEQRYKPYGEVRWSSGAVMPIDFTFTGQRAGPANYVGSLMDYIARGYSPALGRFISADTIVPGAGNPQAFNRYEYVFGNPLRLLDPGGYDPADSQNNCNYAGIGCGGAGSQTDIETQHIILAGTQWWYERRNAQGCADHPTECAVKDGINGVFMILPVALVGTVVLPSAMESYAATRAAVTLVATAESVSVACGGDCSDEAQSVQIAPAELLDVLGARIRQLAGFNLTGRPLIVDNSIPINPQAVAAALRESGFNVKSVMEIFGKDPGDPNIRLIAEQLGGLVISTDRGRLLGESFGGVQIFVDGRVRAVESIIRIVTDAVR